MKFFRVLILVFIPFFYLSTSADAQWIVEGTGKDRTVRKVTPEEALQFAQEYGGKNVMSLEKFKRFLKVQNGFTIKSDGIPDQLLRVLTQENPKTNVEAYIHVVWDDWFNRICALDSQDNNTCSNLAGKCGYSSCTPGAAISGLFGGCAGLLCACALDDGSTFGDAVGMSEISGGSLECDKFIPFGNRRTTQTSDGGGYDPDPYGFPPRY